MLHRAFDEHVKAHVEANPKSNDDTDPNAVHLFELYSDRAALEEVGGAPWLADYNAALEPVLAGKPELSFTSPAWSKQTDAAAIDEASDPPPLGLFVNYRTQNAGREAIRAAWEERVKPHIESDSVRFSFGAKVTKPTCSAYLSSIRTERCWRPQAQPTGSKGVGDRSY